MDQTYVVIHGFHDVVEDKGYRSGDTFVVGDKTDDKRLKSLLGHDAGGRPLIQLQIEEVTENDKGKEPEDKDDGKEPTNDLDALKLEADELGVTYSNNIGFDTLLKKIEDFKNAQGE